MKNRESYKEKCYIMKRKWKAIGNHVAFYLCRIFPVKSNLVSVCTFEGKGGFGCNPKYIVQELHRQSPRIEFVWLVNKEDCRGKEFPDYIRKIPNTLWNRAYWLTRSKVWIDNYRKPYGTIKREGQYYLNTWHANEGFKAIGLLRGASFSHMAYLVSKSDSDLIDIVTIDSRYLADLYRKGLLYDGDYLKVGQCRCDILYGDRTMWKRKFKERNNIPPEAHLVLYAPTFREGVKEGKRTVFSEIFTLDFKRMLKNLKIRFGGEWFLGVRLHPQLADKDNVKKAVEVSDRIIDVSLEDDMYEILAAMDVCITDYSSVAFDAGLCRMPVFLYADDIAQFCKERGGLLWNLQENTDDDVQINDKLTPGYHAVLPYPIAQNNDELEKRILDFDQEKYELGINRMEQELGIVFEGNASVKTAAHILERMGKV